LAPASRAAEDTPAEVSEDPATQVQKLNRQAMQYFEDLNYAAAEKTLLEALALVEKAGLANGPAGLATNGNLAVLYSSGLRNPVKAVFHFKKALELKPDLKMSKQRSTAETEANLARARAELAGEAPAMEGEVGLSPEAQRGAPSTSSDFKCPTGGEIEVGEEITLTCTTSGELRPAAVMLYYKPSGADQYQVVQMLKGSTEGDVTSWVAKIPGSDTRARWVPIYFEARDGSGATLALSGREDSPTMIAVKGGDQMEGAAPVPGAEEEEEGEEEEGEEGEEEGEEGEYEEDEEEIDDTDPLARLERQRWRESHGSKHDFWLSLGPGAGFGYASAHSTEAFGPHYNIGFNSGLAFTGLAGCLLELGYFFGRSTAISVAYRGQYFFSKGPDGTAIGAWAALVRLLFFTSGESRVRWYFALAAGAGEGFRFQVDALVQDQTGKDTGRTVKDTVRGGPFLAGAGGGMLLRLSRRWWWTVLDTQFLLGFANVSAVLDLTTGVRIQF